MKKVLLSILTIGLLAPVTVFAASVHGGSTYTLAKSQTNDGSLYAAGGTITIAGTVTGDIAVAGGQVSISGEAQKDVLVAGGTVDISGTVGEDVRVTGGELTIDTTVPGDVLVAGGSVTISANAIINGDLIVAGGSIAVNGQVKGEIRGAAGEIFLSGPVGGDVSLIARDIKLEATAMLAGDFSYTAPKEATIADGAAVAGKTTFTQREFRFWGRFALGAFGATIIGWLIGLVTMIAAAVVFAVTFKRFTGLVATKTIEKLWIRTALGLAILIVTPVVIGVLFASIIGALLGAALLLAYILYLCLASIYAAIGAGAWIFKLFQKGTMRSDWVAALLGVVVLELVTLIPVVGWLVYSVFFLAALAGLFLTKIDLLQGKA